MSVRKIDSKKESMDLIKGCVPMDHCLDCPDWCVDICGKDNDECGGSFDVCLVDGK